MKYFIYSRKSVYTGKGESVENQIEMCRQYIFSKFPDAGDGEITVYEDEGFSAKNIDRPQFQKMLLDIKTQNPEYVVCYRLDRISRNVSDFSSLIEDLNRLNISFVCIKEEFDTSKPMGKAMMYIASVFAQLERETIAERVRDNMLMLARTGRWLGGTPPTGYTSEKTREILIDGKVKTACQLREAPAELNAIDLIYDKFLELHSISGVSKYLIAQGVKSRSGKHYSLLGIKQILQNPVYCTADKAAFHYFTQQNADVCFAETDCKGKYGLLAYNKRDYKKRHAPRQAMDKWIIAIGRHRGRVPGQKWVAVQNILQENRPSGTRAGNMHNDYSLLSGLIHCGVCGSRMFAKHRSGKGGRGEQFDYICNNKLRGGTRLCNCQNLSGQRTDALVCDVLMPYANSSPRLFSLLEALKADLQRQKRQSQSASIESSIQNCNREMEHLVDALSQTGLGEALVQRVNAKMTELDKARTELIRQRDALQKAGGQVVNPEMQIEYLADKLCQIKRCFSDLTTVEKRTLIRQLVHKIVWDGKDFRIMLSGREQSQRQ